MLLQYVWFASLTLSFYLDESIVWERSLHLGVIAASMFGANDASVENAHCCYWSEVLPEHNLCCN